MEGFFGSDRIALLFEDFSKDSKNLYESMRLAGFQGPTIVLNEDGFLPEGAISIYGYFMGDYKNAPNSFGRSRYFNEIQVPDYWEISGSGSGGAVHDLSHERAKIFYAEPKSKRRVKVVDWYDERKVVRYSDHYNQYGAIFARTIFNHEGKKVNRTYFSPEGQPIIEENFVTRDIILNYEGQTRIFNNLTDFAVYFFEKSGYDKYSIYYNTLSIPFFVSNRLKPWEGVSDVLFWQEPERGDIPGNMQAIFQGEAPRTDRIYVQKKRAYDKLLALGSNPQILHQLGYLYDFKRENKHRPELLICTNSDEIEKLTECIEALPMVHFHIAAITEMSSKLMSKGTYGNVSVYPNVKPKIAERLFENCDLYLDINHGGEILDALSKAFLNNQLIFGIRETLHNTDVIAESHIFEAAKYQIMLAKIRAVLSDEDLWEKELALQKDAALTESKERYRELLK